MDDIAAPHEFLLIVNGDPFEENAGGELELHVESHVIVVANNMPEHDSAAFRFAIPFDEKLRMQLSLTQ